MGKTSAIGTKLLINRFVIGSITSIDGLILKNTVIDVSELTSEDGYREKITGPKDTPELTINGYLDFSVNQLKLYNYFRTQLGAQFDIVFPNGSAWKFIGVVNSFSTDVDIDSAVKFEAKILLRSTLYFGPYA